MDINKRIADNVGLVHLMLHKFSVHDDPDAESVAYEALYKAASSYDDSRGCKFSTYATVIISNAIRGHLRHLNRKRQLQLISYYTPDKYAENKYLLDSLKSNNGADTDYLSKETCKHIVRTFIKHRNALTGRNRDIIELYYKKPKMSQQEIADALNITQATVSRAVAVFKNKLKKELEEYM